MEIFFLIIVSLSLFASVVAYLKIDGSVFKRLLVSFVWFVSVAVFLASVGFAGCVFVLAPLIG